MNRIVLILSLSFLLPALAHADQTPLGLLKAKLEVLRKLADQPKSHDAIREDLKKEMDTFFDYHALGLGAMKDFLDKESPTNRKLFHRYFKAMIQRVYLKRYKPGTKFTNVFGKEQLKGTIATVTTEVKYKRSSAEVLYTLHKTATGWKVLDVTLDDSSLMRSYRSRFSPVAKKDGFAKLLEKMKRVADKK